LYGELNEIPEFAAIKIKLDLDFIWFYANPTSPFVKRIADDSERAHQVYAHVYANDNYDEGRQADFRMLRFSEDMKMAIARMRIFKVDRRARAKMALEQAFNNCVQILEAKLIGLPDEDGSIDELLDEEDEEVAAESKGEAKKALVMAYDKWVTASIKVREEMPKLLRDLEQGFGVVQAKHIADEMTAIELFIEEQTQNRI
jgi:hypothetical protein